LVLLLWRMDEGADDARHKRFFADVLVEKVRAEEERLLLVRERQLVALQLVRLLRRDRANGRGRSAGQMGRAGRARDMPRADRQ
jgi:hypothetical protein